VLIHISTLQNATITERQFKNGTLRNMCYKLILYKTVQCHKTVLGPKRYITKRYSYKTVHVTKRCIVTKRYVTEQYIFIMVQYHNELVGR
jgi:hypothetical protein